jgi:hypothetical protein
MFVKGSWYAKWGLLFRWPRCLARATMGVVRTEIISSTAHALLGGWQIFMLANQTLSRTQ